MSHCMADRRWHRTQLSCYPVHPVYSGAEVDGMNGMNRIRQPEPEPWWRGRVLDARMATLHLSPDSAAKSWELANWTASAPTREGEIQEQG